MNHRILYISLKLGKEKGIFVRLCGQESEKNEERNKFWDHRTEFFKGLRKKTELYCLEI